MELNGSIAVITGVSSGIGKACVEAMLERGVHVVGLGRNAPDIRNEGFRFIEADIRQEDEVKEAFEKTKKEVGAPDILVNNAGLGLDSPIEEMSSEDWHRMFDTNVHGLFYCIRQAVPAMKEKGAGHIVNIASLAGKNGVPNMAGYCGTKHAVVGISESLFKELRQDGIKVSCVLPGSTKTGFFQNVEGSQAHDNMMRPEDIAASVLDLVDTHPNYLMSQIEVRPLKPKG